jgi:hypothetical protein
MIATAAQKRKEVASQILLATDYTDFHELFPTDITKFR